MGQQHDRVQTESQELQPWTAVSTLLDLAAKSKAAGCLTNHLLNAHGNGVK